MERRDFLKGALGTGAAAVVCSVSSGSAEARPNLEPNGEAVGMLYDSTLCVGCKACVAACKEINGMEPIFRNGDEAYDAAADLSGQTLNVIKIFKDGTAAVKDAEQDGFAFEKRSCMHCVDPGCVSACPVTALKQQANTGIVTYDPDACIGCRTCMTACPYNVPQFQYDRAFGKIAKCQMCNQKGVERIDKGMTTGCAEACPTGATLFGTRDALLAEAKRRMELKPGEIYNYPRGDVRKPDSYHEKPVPTYKNHVWGEKEAGGTNVMHISAVSFDKLGMPPLEERSYASISEGVQHSLYSYLALPAVALAGLSFLVKRNVDGEENGGDS